MKQSKFSLKIKAAIAALVVPVAAAITRSIYEVRHVKATRYRLYSAKREKGNDLKIAFLSDLHTRTYGKDNCKLLELIRSLEADYILIGGDMVTASENASDMETLRLLKDLPEIAPTYYAFGNHEERLRTMPDRFPGRFERLMRVLKKYNITLLDNSSADLTDNISIYGLSLPHSDYRKFRNSVTVSKIKKLLGKPDKDKYNILLCHSPKFFPQCKKWGADLVLSGHYHGGIVRVPNGGGLISPDLRLFPKHSVGGFRQDKTDLVVSAGCGTHKINVRLFNMPEVVLIELSS